MLKPEVLVGRCTPSGIGRTPTETGCTLRGSLKIIGVR